MTSAHRQLFFAQVQSQHWSTDFNNDFLTRKTIQNLSPYLFEGLRIYCFGAVSVKNDSYLIINRSIIFYIVRTSTKLALLILIRWEQRSITRLKSFLILQMNQRKKDTDKEKANWE